jgi:hypothetical protein
MFSPLCAAMEETFVADSTLQIFSIGAFTCFCGEAASGLLGYHMLDITPTAMMNGMHWRFFHSIIVMIGISMVKISIGLFLLRFLTGKMGKRFIIGCIIFLVAFTISCAGTLIFNCGTTVEANWIFALHGPQCFTPTTFRNIGIFNSCKLSLQKS